MKKLLTLLFVLLLSACSSGNKETVGNDSVAIEIDTTRAETVLEVVSAEDDVEDEDTISVGVNSTTPLDIRQEEVRAAINKKRNTLYTVSMMDDESTEAMWYFDERISPVYFKANVSGEGESSFKEFFLEGSDVVCSYTEWSSDYDEHHKAIAKWCSTTGGISSYYDEETENYINENLDFEYGANYKVEFFRYLDDLKSVINENNKVKEDENSYTFQSERTGEIGEVHIITTTVKIPKKVYASIME